jgi:hypothetical protein
MDTNREERENGATGRSDIEGKGAQGSAEQGGSRANFKTTDDANVRDDEARGAARIAHSVYRRYFNPVI